MKRSISVAVVALAFPTVAFAHVTVRPRESKPGVEERYTVRVPTEGKVATTSVELEIPEGATVTAIPASGGATHEVTCDGNRIVAITWTKEILPAQVAEFVLIACNPATGLEISWKAHQRYADGTSADWVGPTGDRRPASITKLVSVSSSSGATGRESRENRRAVRHAFAIPFISFIAHHFIESRAVSYWRR